MPAQTPSVGQPKDRVDGRLKVTGGARYSAEMPVAGVAYAVLIMSTIANGRVMAMDTSDAQSQPGVLSVITPFNAPRLPQNPSSSGAGAARPQGRVLQLFQDRDVHYNNQPIGVAVAETLEAATHAARLVRVQYAPMKPVTQIDKASRHDYAPKSANREPTDTLRGDPDTAWNAAKIRTDEVYTTPIENHNPMEPHATIAVWEGDHLTVYDATQGIFGVQSTLARIFHIPNENVRCVSYFVGGGFGCKGSVWSHVPIAAMAAKQVGRPVKLVLEREQMYGMVGYRPVTEQTITLSAAPDGTLTSTTHDVQTQTSTFDEFVESSAAATRLLYSCPNVGTSHRLARLNYGTPTFMRAPGESSGTFALEVAMDELAYELKMDPIALRLKNYADVDEQEKKPFSSKTLRECYRQGAERFGWDRRTAEPGSMKTPDGLLIGMGMGTATYPARRSPASATARIMADGSGYALAGSQDIGTGTYTVMTQVAADALGLPADRVRFELGDTKMPQTPVSGGSQTAASVGTAVMEAGQAARQQAIALAVADAASPLSGLDPSAVTVQDGRLISTADPTHGETYAQLLARHNLPFLEATIQTKRDSAADAYATHSFGAVFAEVHVDPDFGTVRIARITGAYGVGRRLNEKTARSQLLGGVVFGVGMALLEQTMIDPRNGRVMNADLAEYHVPVNADVPEIDIVFVDETEPVVDPLGIKGVGEIGITGVVGAIANAVYHATGTRVRDLPITLDKVAFS
jgi:xanthine dehydrogenase YagR molybdenum-binding subunit